MPQFEGLFAASVTPSRADLYQMNLAASLDVIDFLNDRPGVRGIVLFGATGEFPHFATEDRIRLAHMAIKRSRTPVLVNATHSNLDDAETIAEHARDNGAAGVLLQPPHYYRYADEEIREFYKQFSEEIPEGFPVFLYHLPAFNNGVPVELAVELIAEGHAAGIKSSSEDADYLGRLLDERRVRDFTLFVGNDRLLVEGRSRGADAVISGCACAVPELVAALDQAVCSHDAQRVELLHSRLLEFIDRIETFPGPAGIREALAARGLKMGARAAPFAESTERRAAEFREWLSGWLPGILKECS